MWFFPCHVPPRVAATAFGQTFRVKELIFRLRLRGEAHANVLLMVVLGPAVKNRAAKTVGSGRSGMGMEQANNCGAKNMIHSPSVAVDAVELESKVTSFAREVLHLR